MIGWAMAIYCLYLAAIIKVNVSENLPALFHASPVKDISSFLGVPAEVGVGSLALVTIALLPLNITLLSKAVGHTSACK
jgi:hypothetical protein